MNRAISKDPGAREPDSSASVREKKQPYESRETSAVEGYDSEDDSEEDLGDDSNDDPLGDPDCGGLFMLHESILKDCSAVSHDSGYSEPNSYDGSYRSRSSADSGFSVGRMEPPLVSGDSSYRELLNHKPTRHGSNCNYVSGDSRHLVLPENIQTRSPTRREKSDSELGEVGHVPDDKSQGYNFDGTHSTLVYNQNISWTYNGSSIPDYNLHSDSLASHQYYHANFPAEQNQFSHPSPLIHVNLPKDGSLRTNRSSESTQTSIATDASFDFESLNAASDIETDWEEDEGGRDGFYSDIRQSSRGKRITNAEIRQFREDRLAKDPQKQKTIDRLMTEFYTIFKKAKTGFRSCVEGQSSSSQGSIKGTASKSNLNLTSAAGTKHRISNGEDNQAGEGEEDEERPPKRPRLTSTSTEDKISGLKFACPYHQHNPRKYGMDSLHDKNYRSCAGPGWKSVARIKEHLYRRHRNPIKCSRCCKVFKAQEDLKAHLRILVPCEILPDEPMEGVTDEIEKKLKCRKKTSPDQTEEDRWRAIYQILFPNELIPSPYYEYDNKLAAFENYSRRETPVAFLRLLESRASTNQLTEDIRNDLVDIIQECRIYIYRRYLQEEDRNTRAALDTNTVHSTIPPPLSYNNDSRSDDTNLEVHSQTQAENEDLFNYCADDFEAIFQPDFSTLSSGFYDPSIGILGQSPCYCIDACSCLPSPSSKNARWMR